MSVPPAKKPRSNGPSEARNDQQANGEQVGDTRVGSFGPPGKAALDAPKSQTEPPLTMAGIILVKDQLIRDQKATFSKLQVEKNSLQDQLKKSRLENTRLQNSLEAHEKRLSEAPALDARTIKSAELVEHWSAKKRKVAHAIEDLNARERAEDEDLLETQETLNSRRQELEEWQRSINERRDTLDREQQARMAQSRRRQEGPSSRHTQTR